MDWRHEVSPKWINARRGVITATEISSCISAWKRITEKQREGAALFPPFAALWARKQSTSEPDTWSKGSAARGHILEPYAIDDWNTNHPDDGFFHWDDTLIKKGSLGWSPDGLCVPQETSESIVVERNGVLTDGFHDFTWGLPKSFIEIKSYEPERIMKTKLTMPDKYDERWQMACAFEVLPSLERGVILFYSIDTDLSFSHTYEREDLKDEIAQIHEMVGVWNKIVGNLSAMSPVFVRHATEDQVYQEYLESQKDIFAI